MPENASRGFGIAASWPHDASPYHFGERSLQEKAGVRDKVEQIGRRVIRDHMPDQHRELFGKLPFLIAGSLDERGRPWASILVGHPGFMSSPDPWTLAVRAKAGYGDPLAGNIRSGAPIGLLGIEPATRRRNRMNGTISAVDANGFIVRVGQSFGNCPQYIQARQPQFIADPKSVAAPRPVAREAAILSGRAAAMVQSADTFFIATASPATDDATAGIDVSHRGGRPGFVRLSEEGGRSVLMSPDFSGNFHFATFGNLLLDPKAGMLFFDFATGDLLSLTGEAEVIWEGPEVAAFAGAQRLLRFHVSEGVLIEKAVPLRWSAAELSPRLAGTGSWDAAVQALRAPV